MRKSWCRINACKSWIVGGCPFFPGQLWLQWTPNYQAFVNKKKDEKSLRKKFVLFLFPFFFYVSFVSHHYRDSFICLYLYLLEGKFWLAVKAWPRKQTSSNDTAICCSMCQGNVKVKVEMASVKLGLAQLSGEFPKPQPPPPNSM